MRKRKTRPKKTDRSEILSSDQEKQTVVSQEILSQLPEETQIAYIQSVSFKGPLPPPALNKEYENVLPGSADRIMLMAESEQQHRHGMDNGILVAQK